MNTPIYCIFMYFMSEYDINFFKTFWFKFGTPNISKIVFCKNYDFMSFLNAFFVIVFVFLLFFCLSYDMYVNKLICIFG